MTGSERLAAILREEGGLLGAAIGGTPAPDPLIDAIDGDAALVLAAVREGYRLHYGEATVVRTGDDDLALLGGDRLYALGVARLAQAGDLAAVALLAQLIARVAQAHAEDDPQAADAAWRSTASSFAR